MSLGLSTDGWAKGAAATAAIWYAGYLFIVVCSVAATLRGICTGGRIVGATDIDGILAITDGIFAAIAWALIWSAPYPDFVDGGSGIFFAFEPW